MEEQEFGSLQNWWGKRQVNRNRRSGYRRSRSRVSSRVSGRGGNGIKRLGRRNAGCGMRRKHFMRLQRTFLEMRLVCKEVATEHARSALDTIARALTKDMVGVATMHATRKSERAGALEISGWVDRKFGWCWLGGGLVSLNRLFCWRHERSSKAWSIREGPIRYGGG